MALCFCRNAATVENLCGRSVFDILKFDFYKVRAENRHFFKFLGQFAISSSHSVQVKL